MKPYYDEDGITIYHGDCREILPGLPESDLVLTDPPYGKIWARGAKGMGTHTRSSVRRTALSWDTRPTPDAIRALVGAGRTAIVWGGNYFTDALPPSNCWLVWDKRLHMPLMPYADAELAWTNMRAVVRLFRRLSHGCIGKTEPRIHPTQKPVALMRWCIEHVADCKDIIDPYMGSGTTLVAAKALGCRAIGVEIKEEYCEIATTRLAQGALSP